MCGEAKTALLPQKMFLHIKGASDLKYSNFAQIWKHVLRVLVMNSFLEEFLSVDKLFERCRNKKTFFAESFYVSTTVRNS